MLYRMWRRWRSRALTIIQNLEEGIGERGSGRVGSKEEKETKLGRSRPIFLGSQKNKKTKDESIKTKKLKAKNKEGI